MNLPERILLASGNRHKLAELGRMLAPLGLTVVTPDEVGGLPDVDEDQTTFAGNAAKKALAATKHCGLWALADDSGLEVDALDGAPGVHSARYAGQHGDDAGNNARLLRELQDRPDGERGARFVCALALARPSEAGPEVALELQGEARGRILHAPEGEAGFGYDPLFCFTEPGFAVSERCFGTLSGDEKGAVSHRGRALRDLVLALRKLGVEQAEVG